MTTPHLLTAAAVTLLVLAGGVITAAYLFRDRTPASASPPGLPLLLALLRVVVVLAVPVVAAALFLLVLGVLSGDVTPTGAVSALDDLVRAVGDLLRAAVEHTGPTPGP
ncbi:hypothetical protein OG218_02185 [Kineococcus sp. NBC_00420]|uniref:hypothetical protein n=1 Tax=Kineococcus sp. NBC_00420 TaxID=2903564 RepID=UPI002E21BEAA